MRVGSVALFARRGSGDGETWSLRAEDGPPARAKTPLAYDSLRGVTVLFGGGKYSLDDPPGETHFGDTWEWDGSTWTQIETSDAPSLAAHGMVWDSLRHVAVVFGGEDGSTPLEGDTTGRTYELSWPSTLGDLNRDGVVDGADLRLLLGAWGGAAGDLDGNGTTNGADLGILLGAWTG